MINKIKHSPNDTLVVSIGGFNALFGSFWTVDCVPRVIPLFAYVLICVEKV